MTYPDGLKELGNLLKTLLEFIRVRAKKPGGGLILFFLMKPTRNVWAASAMKSTCLKFPQTIVNVLDEGLLRLRKDFTQ
jgi:hypothetical protein